MLKELSEGKRMGFILYLLLPPRGGGGRKVNVVFEKRKSHIGIIWKKEGAWNSNYNSSAQARGEEEDILGYGMQYCVRQWKKKRGGCNR